MGVKACWCLEKLSARSLQSLISEREDRASKELLVTLVILT